MPRRSISSQVSGEPVADVLARRPRQAKRDRSWEQAQRGKGVVTYRGVPASLSKQITAIAGELDVPVGDVARSFLEYGLQAYRAGDLELEPVLAIGRFTLHPQEKG